MSLSRRRFNQLLAGGLGVALAPNVLAGLVEGQDWRAIARPQSEAPEGKIELAKFFSYGCPFCGQLARVMKPWLAELPDDVVFRRIPISFNRAAWANLARLALALEETGLAAELDQAVFDAVGVDREPLFTETAILDWLADKDVDTEAFRQVFNASHIRAQVARNDRLQARFGINSVPTLVVDGRFVVVGEQARSFDDILEIAGELIDKARA
ncbi:thiol:disulfide interchange protein DsbA/DsbL [Ectothiorhodospira shaposhnikovii]|uniref:thiol:disulfide interchange protein DsbA/DsbL n=1 Tax=Ectothiorhodospira shaposhnikovii TaxID=1054 RepID=UPI001EE80911|nr:thiol:disulfide interchange protein DsbA/DsbL [Ectothiorhodospira shaposhnikovii]MCG5512366.1 thiol:disulfide interchange protein DsbA/DsbL [Ectothiorhodospira shaposhnikovii]